MSAAGAGATASSFADVWTNQRAPWCSLDQTDRCNCPCSESRGSHRQHLWSTKQRVNTNAETETDEELGQLQHAVIQTHEHFSTYSYSFVVMVSYLYFIYFVMIGLSHNDILILISTKFSFLSICMIHVWTWSNNMQLMQFERLFHEF